MVATAKGLMFEGFVKQKSFRFQCKKWIKNPDNVWKIFIFFASPVVGFIGGVLISSHIRIFIHYLFH
jgi:hypothetical protein